MDISEGGDEECHLGQTAYYHQDCIMPLGQRKSLNEVHRYRVPGSLSDWEETMRAKRLVMEGLSVATDQTGVDVVGDKGDHLGPIELAVNVLDHLGNAMVTRKVVVMAGMKDTKLGGLVVGHIQLPLVEKE